MTTKVFIDGEAGTTGLQIRDRLSIRSDITLISLDPTHRKDNTARVEAFAQADIAILCLPDQAAIQAVELAGQTRLIDASTAHRVNPEWVYGMAELPEQRDKIAQAKRVANVGCYATGAIALIRPLREAHLIENDVPLVLTGVSGYTGGGKALVAEYEPEQQAPPHFLYAAGQNHKHIPEIMTHALIRRQPHFQPSVGNFAQGMVVQLHLPREAISEGTTLGTFTDILHEFYAHAHFIKVIEAPPRIDATALNGTNLMHLSVHGNEEMGLFTLTATLDNLGKGASGAAVQNLNLMMSVPETTGLL